MSNCQPESHSAESGKLQGNGWGVLTYTPAYGGYEQTSLDFFD